MATVAAARRSTAACRGGFVHSHRQQYRQGQLCSAQREGVRRASSSATETIRAADAGGAPSPSGAGAAAPPRVKRVLSGMQPTGSGLHLGNYLGAMRSWLALQDQYETYYCVVDLHAVTVAQDPVALRAATLASAAVYVAAGLDPERATLFVQSHVPAHSEMTWLLNCVTPLGWMERMIQFKEKRKSGSDEASLGLLAYPALMAADILLYRPDVVPVGEDQRQHLELTRNIAERVNHLYGGKKWKKRGGRGGSLFRVPEALIPESCARVMSLQDATNKMSKSAENDMSRINILDPPELIEKKIKRCKTDSFDGLEFDNPDRPEVTNLLSIYMLVTGKTRDEVLAECSSMRWGEFKPVLAEALVEHMRPIQTRYAEIMDDRSSLDAILARGAANASEVADATLADVRDAMGFLNRT